MKTSTLINVDAYTMILSLPVLVAWYIYFEPHNANRVKIDPHRYISALQEYSDDLKDRGVSLPESIPMKELLQQGYLTFREVEPYAGAEVYYHTKLDENSPGAVLFEAHMPDGTVFTALNDGSVQDLGQTRSEQNAAGQSKSGGW